MGDFWKRGFGERGARGGSVRKLREVGEGVIWRGRERERGLNDVDPTKQLTQVQPVRPVAPTGQTGLAQADRNFAISWFVV